MVGGNPVFLTDRSIKERSLEKSQGPRLSPGLQHLGTKKMWSHLQERPRRATERQEHGRKWMRQRSVWSTSRKREGSSDKYHWVQVGRGWGWAIGWSMWRSSLPRVRDVLVVWWQRKLDGYKFQRENGRRRLERACREPTGEVLP